MRGLDALEELDLVDVRGLQIPASQLAALEQAHPSLTLIRADEPAALVAPRRQPLE
ncbi:MAG: hypothetical protein H7138_07160 [Myxococcales bacterium]|nr:hypothetical protein [Myxococcales bacterium]